MVQSHRWPNPKFCSTHIARHSTEHFVIISESIPSEHVSGALALRRPMNDYTHDSMRAARVNWLLMSFENKMCVIGWIQCWGWGKTYFIYWFAINDDNVTMTFLRDVSSNPFHSAIDDEAFSYWTIGDRNSVQLTAPARAQVIHVIRWAKRNASE